MNLERASAICSQALERQPKHRDALYLLLQATLRLGRFEAALERSQKLVQAYPDQGSAYLLAGTAAFWADDDQAISWLKQAADLSLDRPSERLEALCAAAMRRLWHPATASTPMRPSFTDPLALHGYRPPGRGGQKGPRTG